MHGLTIEVVVALIVGDEEFEGQVRIHNGSDLRFLVDFVSQCFERFWPYWVLR
jgi:hypothetical protein